jgi:hypothetical protein
MSCYWGYRCRTCDEVSDHEANHGEEMLNELWLLRDHIVPLSNAAHFDLNLTGNRQIGRCLDFLISHHDHDLCLHSEYSNEFNLPLLPTSTATEF